MNPSKPDLDFIEKFVETIESHHLRFVVFIGGGGLSRQFQQIASQNMKTSNFILDELGIVATRINASLLKSEFGSIAEEKIILDPNKKLIMKRKVAVGGGWKPGASTDDCAVRFAAANKIRTVINISNTNFIYDKDPKKYPEAKPLRKTSWKVIQKIVGKKWKPGLHVPFDPVATRLASKKKIKMVFLGPDIGNFRNYLAGKDFNGTIVS